MTTALIDADIVAFRAAAKVQDVWEDQPIADERMAIREAEVIIQNWIKFAKPNNIIMCLSCPSRTYFRHDIYPEYKGNRKGLEPPIALKAVKEWFYTKYKVVTMPGLEADDVMGILGTDPNLNSPVIISIDKDMLTVPTKYLNPDKMRRPVRNNARQCDLLVMHQAMTGDSTDNYKGIPGVGKVKADKILAELGNPWVNTEKAFLENGLTSSYALTMMRLARILRYEDYNQETGEVRLWHPTTPEWILPSTLSTTNSETESKSSTSSKPSVEDSQEVKPSSQQTSSNTSVATATKKVRRQRKTSKKQSGTSTDSSTTSRKEDADDS